MCWFFQSLKKNIPSEFILPCFLGWHLIESFIIKIPHTLKLILLYHLIPRNRQHIQQIIEIAKVTGITEIYLNVLSFSSLKKFITYKKIYILWTFTQRSVIFFIIFNTTGTAFPFKYEWIFFCVFIIVYKVLSWTSALSKTIYKK